MKILELLNQRRVWIGILGTLAFILPMLGITPTANIQGATDLFVNLFTALNSVIMAGLALWSYFKPKK